MSTRIWRRTAACTLILTSFAGNAASQSGVEVTVRGSDNSSGSNPYFSTTTTVGSGIEGQASFLNGTISESIDISDSQIILGLSFSSTAIAALPIPHFWLLDFQTGTNIASLLETSDVFPAGSEIVSFGNGNVTLRINPFPTVAGPFKATAIYDVTLAPVPEPSTYALMLAGLGVVAYVARRRVKFRESQNR